MKKLIVIMLMLGIMCAGDFRGNAWGTDSSKIKDTVKLTKDKDGYLSGDGYVSNYKANVCYSFSDKGKLVRGVYFFEDVTTYAKAYSIYEALKNKLDEKYGYYAEDEIWGSNGLYESGDYEYYPTCISLGYLGLYSEYETEDTIISLLLSDTSFFLMYVEKKEQARMDKELADRESLEL